MNRHEHSVWFGRDLLLLVRENEMIYWLEVTEPLVNVYSETTFCKFKEIS